MPNVRRSKNWKIAAAHSKDQKTKTSLLSCKVHGEQALTSVQNYSKTDRTCCGIHITSFSCIKGRGREGTGGALVTQKLNSMILLSPFKLGQFCLYVTNMNHHNTDYSAQMRKEKEIKITRVKTVKLLFFFLWKGFSHMS